MKTLIKTTALLVTLTILLSVNLIASAYNISEETYIDDISFNTKCVTIDCLYNKAISIDFQLEEEEYVDDIPFDTECVTANCLYRKAMLVEYDFEEEEYIDDIGL